MTYTTAHVRIPESAVINLKNASHKISSKITIPTGGAQGVIACQGGNMSGWSLYLDKAGKPTYHYNCFGQYLTTICAEEPLAEGDHEILLDYQHDGGFGRGGQATLYIDGESVNSDRIERTVPIIFSMSGETFDVGVDTGAPVGPYPHEYPFSGEIHKVVLERMGRRDHKTKKKMKNGLRQAGLRSQ
jgi:arylsulfatase